MIGINFDVAMILFRHKLRYQKRKAKTLDPAIAIAQSITNFYIRNPFQISLASKAEQSLTINVLLFIKFDFN